MRCSYSPQIKSPKCHGGTRSSFFPSKHTGKCMKPGAVDLSTICIPPGKKDSLGKCCMPPLEVMNGICMNPPEPAPKPTPFSIKFRIGVIDGYKIDESAMNSQQKPYFEEVKKQIHGFMEACPSSIIYLTGFTDK